MDMRRAVLSIVHGPIVHSPSSSHSKTVNLVKTVNLARDIYHSADLPVRLLIRVSLFIRELGISSWSLGKNLDLADNGTLFVSSDTQRT